MRNFLKTASVAGVISAGVLALSIPAYAHSEGYGHGEKHDGYRDYKYHGQKRHHDPFRLLYKYQKGQGNGYNHNGLRYGNPHYTWPHKKYKRHHYAYKHGYKYGSKHHYKRHAYNGQRNCHRVRKYKRDHYGDKVRVVGTKCYDRHGYGYIVPGSRRTQHVY